MRPRSGDAGSTITSLQHRCRHPPRRNPLSHPTPDPIDRLAPTLRPAGPAVMRQDWHHLLFLHWDVPADRLRPLLPPGLELDLFEGRAFVGLIPFTMTGVRPVGLPAVPLLSNFHETNVRTYVHFEGRDPGVWFFSLDAANPVAVMAARAWFHLPYHFARMSLSSLTDPGTLSYTSERRWPGPRPASSAIRCRAPRAGLGGTGRHPRPLPGRALHPLRDTGRADLPRPGPPRPLPAPGRRRPLARRDPAGRGRDRTARRPPARAFRRGRRRRSLPPGTCGMKDHWLYGNDMLPDMSNILYYPP